MPVNAIASDARYLDTVQFDNRAASLDGPAPRMPDTVTIQRPAFGAAIAPAAPGEAKPGFAQMLGQALGQVNHLQVEADRHAELLATGRATNPHDVVLALEKADLALQLTIKITEKAIGAYRQLSQMQL